MPYVQQGIIVGLILLIAGMAWAGGSNYGIAPGSRPQVEGKIHECQVPTPKFARDPAPRPESGSQPRRMAAAPDGSLWVTLYGKGKLLHDASLSSAVQGFRHTQDDRRC